MKGIATFIIVLTLGCVTNVNAAVSEEDYAKLREIFSEARLSIMSEEEIEELVNGDLTYSSKTYEVTESVNGTFTYSEVDPETAEQLLDNFNNGIALYGATHETSYKRITILDNYIGGNTHDVTVYTQWIINPRVKSFDVIAMRIDDGYVVDGTQDGTQMYHKNGVVGWVNYSANGTNIRKADDGFGISMNLVNDASNFEADISATVISTSQDAVAYGTYQHAVTDVTLDQSQSYMISHNGLGGVLNFSNSVYNLYDRMSGVSIAL